MQVPLVALALAAAVSPLAASTLTVGPAGSGAAFSDIQAAIDAAQPGDTILVLPGSYTSFTLSKAVDLLGAGSTHVQIGSPDPIVVQGVPAGGEAVLSGFTAVEQPRVRVWGNAGSVTLHDVVLAQEPTFPCGDEAGLDVQGSDRVVVLASSIRGVDGTGGHGLEAIDSEVWLIDSELEGGHGGPFGTSCTTAGGAGAHLDDSALYVARSRVQGGVAYSSFGMLGGAPAAIVAYDSFLKIVGGPGTVIQVGVYAAGGSSFPGAGSAMYLTGSQLLIQDDVDVIPESDKPPYQLSGGSTALTPAFAYPTLAVSAPQTPPGAALALAFSGNPGAIAILAYGPNSAPSIFVPGIDGALALDLADAVIVAQVPVGPGGTATWSVVVPPLPALLGTTAFFQSLEVLGPQSAFSNPVLTSIQ